MKHYLYLEIILHELSVLQSVLPHLPHLPHLHHPESLHDVQLLGQVGQIHGGVELALQQGVVTVLRTQ